MVPFSRLGLLLLYLVLLFVLVRVIETLAWYEAGFLAAQVIDPFSLSVRKLKNLLDGRGVSYDGVVEKKEMTNLVQASGDVLEGELELLEQEKDEDPDSTLFTCGAHFYEEVEDKKDSVWIVQITPYGHVPLLPESTWEVLTRKVASFGIRTGKFDCALDYRFCHRRGWVRSSSLILAMPQGTRHKDQVTMVSYTSTNHRDSYILAWVNHQLATKIHTIPDIHDAVDYWLNAPTTDHNYPDKYPIKVSLFSDGPNVPLFYSAASMTFSGRIKFGHMKVENRKFADQLGLAVLPTYMITTPEGMVHYGKQKGQYLKYRVLDLYLRTLYPEANDLLLLCFMLVNSMCVLELFLTPGGAAKRICCFLWVVGKYNLGLLIVWLPLLGLFQFSLMNPVWRLGLKVIRLLSQTAFMSQLRYDWVVYSAYSKWMIFLYLGYCLVVGWLKTWRQGSIPESDVSSSAWLRSTMQQFYNFLLRPSPRFYTQPLSNPILEDGLDAWIVERMATPDLWLRDIVPTEYINDLPTWKYCGDQWHDLEELPVVQTQPQKMKHHFGQTRVTDSLERKNSLVNFSPICSWCHGIVQSNGNDNGLGQQNQRSKISDIRKTIAEKLGFGCNNNKKVQKLSKVLCCKEKNKTSTRFNRQHTPDQSKGKSKSKEHLSDKNIDLGQSQLDSIHLRCTPGLEGNVQGNNSRVEDINVAVCSTVVTTDSSKGQISKVKSHGDSQDQGQSNHILVGDMPVAVCNCKRDSPGSSSGQSSKVKYHADGDPWLDTMLECSQCAICLDSYAPGVRLCGLPCGHTYHHQCILMWLEGGKHLCPNCRWPAFKAKKPKLSKHME